MRICMFYHSLASDWNHGNAHFLRGVVRCMIREGHDVRVYEPSDGWSCRNLVREHGSEAKDWYRNAYPELSSNTCHIENLDLKQAIGDVDLVLVHEWNEPELVNRIAKYHVRHNPSRRRLLFHDTHHRIVSRPNDLKALDLKAFDSVLAFGQVIAERYRQRKLAKRVWVWHEAADTTVFYPRKDIEPTRDLIWVGNWGDGERAKELHQFLLEPARQLGLTGTVYGVRYPDHAKAALRRAGLHYGGYLPNYRVPEEFARHRVTVHVPRRPYVKMLPGIPTIRPFEALACGIPLVSAPWKDEEKLFTVGRDFMMVTDGDDMRKALAYILENNAVAERYAQQGHATIIEHHTIAHRVQQLMAICRELGLHPGMKPTSVTAASHATSVQR